MAEDKKRGRQMEVEHPHIREIEHVTRHPGIEQDFNMRVPAQPPADITGLETGNEAKG
ncbi:hypothetical protein [Bacillus marinisedimentorum]|uniref:hypothetical protein n=1 Tax=Bacillus marinisedimentorum TaxID=1821260 RepID=UPI0012FFAD34|nr:hypothetical protein [Bacillus marinisedimentorum]